MREREQFVTTINLPQERRAQVLERLKEHQKTLELRLSPAQRLEVSYEAMILYGLLKNGSVDTIEMSADIFARNYGDFASEIFRNACNVVDDFCRTGGVNTTQNRGLPRVDRN